MLKIVNMILRMCGWINLPRHVKTHRKDERVHDILRKPKLQQKVLLNLLINEAASGRLIALMKDKNEAVNTNKCCCQACKKFLKKSTFYRHVSFIYVSFTPNHSKSRSWLGIICIRMGKNG